MITQLPPLLPYPGDGAADDVMKRYVDRLWLYRQVEREDAAVEALAAHRTALEVAAGRQAMAVEAMVVAAVTSNEALAAHITAYETSATRQATATEGMLSVARAGLFTEGAVALLSDRTSSVTTASVMAEAIRTSVRDAKATVDAMLAQLPQ